MTHLRLGTGREFDAIARMVARWGDMARGIGDDAAILAPPAGERLAISTDATVEGVHFRPGWISAQEVGYRAVTAAASDLAAMGARPLAMTVALVLTPYWRAQLDALADGIGEAARAAALPIVGGDLSMGDQLAITVTVLGTVAEPLGRDGAFPGLALYVTGRLGGPAAAVAAWERGDDPTADARRRFAHPAARLAEARWLRAHGATAAIDLSDGLLRDAGHLAAASGVRLAITLDDLPVVDGVDRVAAAASGEEYELLVAAPAGLPVAEFARAFGLELTRIGAVEAAAPDGAPGVVATWRGTPVPPDAGFDHFAR